MSLARFLPLALLVLGPILSDLSAQAVQDFEGIATNLNCGSATCFYTDPDPASSPHDLQNNNGVPVNQAFSSGVLGFVSSFIPSRTGSSNSGLTDGDSFGVATNGQLSASSAGIGTNAQSGTQAFMAEDTDGWVTITFSEVDLDNAATADFNMYYFIDASSYEFSDGANDRVYIRLELTDCASAQTIVLLDTDGGGTGGGGGGDINNLGIENSWNLLNANLNSFTACTAQLIIELDLNSASEEAAFDNISFSVGTVLPVELLEFQARERETDVELQWATASEQQNDFFSVERSTDGRNFQSIGRVIGQGDSEDISRYSFIDDSPHSGDNFYRLMQQDFDGSTHQSGLVKVDFRGSVTQSDLTISPNPAQDYLRISSSGRPLSNTRFQLLDSFGRILQTLAVVNPEEDTFNLSLTGLPAGMYYLRAGTSTYRFIKR